MRNLFPNFGKTIFPNFGNNSARLRSEIPGGGRSPSGTPQQGPPGGRSSPLGPSYRALSAPRTPPNFGKRLSPKLCNETVSPTRERDIFAGRAQNPLGAVGPLWGPSYKALSATRTPPSFGKRLFSPTLEREFIGPAWAPSPRGGVGPLWGPPTGPLARPGHHPTLDSDFFCNFGQRLFQLGSGPKSSGAAGPFWDPQQSP